MRLNRFLPMVALLTAMATLTTAQTPTPAKSYTQTIPGSNQTYAMVAIPGGKFLMGSTPDQKGHKSDESPMHSETIAPFYMGKYEVTWDLYDLFAFTNMEKEMAAKYTGADANLTKTDATTRPSPPYVDMSFGMGRAGYPAINMTQYAAIKFCAWLYAKTGVFYRLPTEAEWEYACRGTGPTAMLAYSFGNDVKQLGEYAVFAGNSGGGYKKVGTKKPNSFGLYDMHGNVMEWTQDQYIEDYYKQKATGKVSEPYAPTKNPLSQCRTGWLVGRRTNRATFRSPDPLGPCLESARPTKPQIRLVADLGLVCRLPASCAPSKPHPTTKSKPTTTSNLSKTIERSDE